MFVDETKARGVLLTAAAVHPADLAAARRAIRGLVMPGQRRIHFIQENDGRRKMILDRIAEFSPLATIYDGSALPRRRQREACLRELVTDLVIQDARMLVLERDDSIVDMDNRVLYARIHEVNCVKLRYEHLRTHEEPLLAIPDAIAWCWQRGDPWRQRVREMVVGVRTL
ncbi:hypothetical protein [Actinocrispum wychmicini]|nr:hypothetical protein [Actinocrispum wychmicini]